MSVLIRHQFIDLILRDLVFIVLAYNITAGLQALDVVTSDTNVYLFDFEIGVRCPNFRAPFEWL